MPANYLSWQAVANPQLAKLSWVQGLTTTTEILHHFQMK